MKHLLFLILILLIGACKSVYQLPKYPNTVEGFSWLLGTWQVDEKQIFESWVDKEDGQYYGTTYKVQDQDTIEIERIVLSSDSSNVFYLATVPNQNDGLPVPFKMIKVGKNSAYFENRKHDFPQYISYDLKTDRLIHVQLGKFKGERLEKNQIIELRKVRGF
jgi:hypothetical protein